ncbi:MAG: MBL fold metallo-hydrolase [Bacteroidales bacterium]|jgi:glyoxylase-like metal-dependent hydrolase (beta-lactamase superfamily II)
MKTFKFYLVGAMLASMVCPSNALDRKDIPIRKEKVTKNIILYKTGETSANPNMVAVKTSKGIVVVDALQYPELAGKVRKMITREFGNNIAYLVNTHAASDHTGGATAFDDIPIIGHSNIKMEQKREHEMASSSQYQEFLEKMSTPSEKFWTNYPGNPLEIDESVANTRNMLSDIKNNALKLIVPDTLFDDQYVLNMGNRTLKMYHNIPSYSESDIIIYIPEEKALIIGDIFNKQRLPWINQNLNLESWEKLFAPYLAEPSEVKYFIGTHGSVMTRDEVRDQFNYLKKLLSEVQRLKKEGKTVEDALKELALDKFPYLSNFNPYFYGTPIHMHNRNIQVMWMQLS